MTKGLETRSGIKPEIITPEFKITTADIQRYFNRELNQISNGAVQCNVFSIKASSNAHSKLVYYPLLVVLPNTAAVTQQKKNKEADVSGPSLIGLSRSKRGSALKLNPALWGYFKNYLYDDSIDTSTWSHTYGLSRGVATKIRNFRKPTEWVSNGVSYIMFYINPLSVFWDMVADIGKSNHYIEVRACKYMASGMCEYTVKKVPKDSNYNKKENSELSRQIHRFMNNVDFSKN